MQKLITCISLFLLTAQCFSQKNVFILVDVSGSMNKYSPHEAKDVIISMLLGNKIANSNFYYDADPQSTLGLFNGTPLVSVGNKLLIMPFGDKGTSAHYRMTTIANFPTDVAAFVNQNYPVSFNDGYTYITLAKARAAEIAKQNQINDDYLLVLITDDINDYTGGKSPNYTTYEQNLVDGYYSKSNPANELKIDGFIRKKGEQDFKIPIRMVDIRNYQPPTKHSPGPPTQTPIKPCEINLTSYAGGKSKQEKEVKTENMVFSWNCSCSDSTKYSISILEYGSSSNLFRETKGNLTSNSYSVKLKDGKYKIVVSGTHPNRNISTASTYISVNTGSYSWLLLLLFLIIIAVAGVFIYRRMRERRLANLSSSAAEENDNWGSKNNPTSFTSSNNDF